MGLSQAQIERAAEVRRKILEVTAQVILKAGVHDLTIEAVAREAGVSKGGLLHHFSSKMELLGALMDDLLARFEASLSRFVDADPDPRGRHVRAYINATAASSPEENRLGVAVVAALMFEPALIRRWQRSAERLMAQDRREKAPLRASALRLVADALWLSDVFGMYPFTPQERQDMTGWLLDMSRR